MRRRHLPFLLGTIAALSLMALAAGCGAPRPQLRPEGPYWIDADTRDIPEPAGADPRLAWQTIDRTVFNQLEQYADIERDVRIILGDREEAWNINAVDEVPDCSWFTNRHGLHRMSPDEIRRGVSLTGGPDTTGPWTLFRPKVGGKTPGFRVEDPRGKQYIIKFDPVDNPELATAAGAMGARYFHAAGYNVPEETIVFWRPEQLRIRDGLAFTDRSGIRRPFTSQDLQDILKRVRREPDGRIRSLASLALPNVKGPFSYTGTRADDPNDWCRHEHRRELRGLYVIASLINHYDLKDQNSLDCYVEEDGRCFLRHYLIDFGSTFGSNGDRPKEPLVGYANGFDLRDAIVSMVTLGLWTWPWEKARPYEYPSIGYFESQIFRPHKFDAVVPNPALENMTSRDAYWGAKIVMAFRDDDIRAIVDAGQYSDAAAADYLLRTLIERRDKIGRHWFAKVNPLDNFMVTDGSQGLLIAFDDLAVKYDLESSHGTRYRHFLYHNGKRLAQPTPGTERVIRVPDSLLQVISSRVGAAEEPESGNHLVRIDIQSKRGDQGWSKPVRLWLWHQPEASDARLRLVGVEHID